MGTTLIPKDFLADFYWLKDCPNRSYNREKKIKRLFVSEQVATSWQEVPYLKCSLRAAYLRGKKCWILNKEYREHPQDEAHEFIISFAHGAELMVQRGGWQFPDPPQ